VIDDIVISDDPSIDETFDGRQIDVIEDEENANSPIVCKRDSRSNENSTSREQPAKQRGPTISTLAGRITCRRPESANAQDSILFSDDRDSKASSVSERQKRKHEESICSILRPIDIFIIEDDSNPEEGNVPTFDFSLIFLFTCFIRQIG
jgi:hypothetical protein